jgi:hypothetical protein
LKIPEDFKKYILSEFDFIIQKMREEKNPKKKLYYFTASYGALERLMRYSLDPQLLLTHAILNLCYGSLNSRLNSIARGDVVVEMPENFDEKLIEYLTELRNEIAENQDTYQTLEKFVHLAYQTTGAGYYTKNYLRALETKKVEI